MLVFNDLNYVPAFYCFTRINNYHYAIVDCEKLGLQIVHFKNGFPIELY